MREFFKKEAAKYADLNHQQWGWVSGMILGFALGIYVLSKFGLQEIDWEIVGKIDSDSPLFKLIVEASVVPLSSGLFANLFSNMGAGIDVITNKETILSWFYKKYSVRTGERELLLPARSINEGGVETDDLGNKSSVRVTYS